MNCLEFRRRMLSDPMQQDGELREHEATCSECGPFARRLRADELRLRAILTDVAVPDGLAERVRLAARFERRAERRRFGWYAAAAGVLLVVGASLVSLWTTALERGQQTLAQAVINHIEDESSHLRAAGPVPMARVKWVFRRFGAELAGDIGQVNFAAECLMRRRNGVHLVMPGRMGPVTAFFMPGEMTEHTIAVRSERFVGHIVPTSWGSIAVVGEQGESLQGLGERLAAVVRWPGGSVSDSVVTGQVVGSLFDRPTATQQQDG